MSRAIVSILKHPASTVLAAARALGYTGADDKMTAAEWIVVCGHVQAFEGLVASAQPAPILAYKPSTAMAALPPAKPAKPDPVFVPVVNDWGQKAMSAITAVDNQLQAVVVAVAKLTGDLSGIDSRADSAKLAAATARSEAQRAATQAGDMVQQARADMQKTETELRRAIADAVAQLQARPAPVIDPAAVATEVSQAVAAAFKPFAQAVTDAGAESTIGAMTSASIVDRKTAKQVFGVNVNDAKGSPVMVDIWDHPGAPAVDPTFIWSKPILRHLLLSQSTGENVWFGGDKGTGKSETARQFAARTGRGFTRINFHKYSAQEDYLGATGLQAGSTAFEPQAFLKAYTSPSTVILLDEVTNADPGNLAPLNGLLEPGAAVSIGGHVWRRAPGVLVFAADNTLGSGDQSGRYAGTREMNSSLIDRFPRIVRFDFLPMKSEVEAVVRHTGCVPELAEHILQAVNIARQKVTTGDIVDAPSIRSVIGFIRALAMMPVEDAWASSIAARQPAESALALEAIRTASIDESKIKGWI
jgi:MoxR-like ATPase